MRSAIPRTALLSASRASRFLPAYRQARFYSLKATATSTSVQRPLEASRLSVEETKNPKTLSKPEDLVFGKEFTGEFLFILMDI
jgi:branched-chain amino acid aminotransferase